MNIGSNGVTEWSIGVMVNPEKETQPSITPILHYSSVI
jgi:hypothetical protein